MTIAMSVASATLVGMTDRQTDFEHGTGRVEVIDSSQRHSLPTGRVHTRWNGATRPSDAAFAMAAGYSQHEHFGYKVEHHDDNMSTVHLYND